MSALIEFDSVCKYYQMGDTLVKAADHVSFQINKGEFVAIVGQSGSGKSTCMNIIGCLDVPTEGTYLLDGRDVGRMTRRELASIRNEKLGFIFQQYNLLTKLTLLENVEVPLVYAVIGTVKVGTDSYSNTTVKGVSEVYFDMLGYTIDEGRLLNYVDLENNKKVCVVGAYINRVAYGGNAVGQTIKIGSTRYTIVGVLEAKVTDLEDQEGSNDDMIFVPYTTAMRANHSSTVSSYSVAIADENKLSEGKAIFESALQELLHSDKGYMVTSLSEMLDTMTSMVNMVVTILTAIAAISLLVGGIGIMNIMMVSVTERTREIGIRKALGAQESTILGLFVTEAAATSALGGVLGYLLSAVANRILPMVLTDMTLTVSPSIGSVAVAFGISVGIGVLFGFLPARRAARLNPIEALRYD